MEDQRDHAEETYWRRFCPACGVSPCEWNGEPDGFHTDETDTERAMRAVNAATRDELNYALGVLTRTATDALRDALSDARASDVVEHAPAVTS